MENHHFEWENQGFQWPFSIANTILVGPGSIPRFRDPRLSPGVATLHSSPLLAARRQPAQTLGMGGSMWKHEGNLRKNPRKTLGRPWKTLRKPWKTPGEMGKTLGKTWKTGKKIGDSKSSKWLVIFNREAPISPMVWGLPLKKIEKHISTTTPKKRWG